MHLNRSTVCTPNLVVFQAHTKMDICNCFPPRVFRPLYTAWVGLKFFVVFVYEINFFEGTSPIYLHIWFVLEYKRSNINSLQRSQSHTAFEAIAPSECAKMRRNVHAFFRLMKDVHLTSKTTP